MILKVILFFICYFICSINPAIEICKKKTGQDIRDLGSGNAGTTNAIRVLGRPIGTFVFILDVLKVVIAYILLAIITKIFSVECDSTIMSAFMLGAVIGHCYPAIYGFKGGKGIVTLLVSAVIINRQIAIVCIIVGAIIIVITRTVSKGSLTGVLLFVIMTFVMIPEYILAVSVVSAIVIYKHKDNIIRIMNKEESKIF